MNIKDAAINALLDKRPFPIVNVRLWLDMARKVFPQSATPSLILDKERRIALHYWYGRDFWCTDIEPILRQLTDAKGIRRHLIGVRTTLDQFYKDHPPVEEAPDPNLKAPFP